MVKELNKITETVIGAAMAVHRERGPGLLESAYDACLVFELADRGLVVEKQKPSVVHPSSVLAFPGPTALAI